MSHEMSMHSQLGATNPDKAAAAGQAERIASNMADSEELKAKADMEVRTGFQQAMMARYDVKTPEEALERYKAEVAQQSAEKQQEVEQQKAEMQEVSKIEAEMAAKRAQQRQKITVQAKQEDSAMMEKLRSGIEIGSGITEISDRAKAEAELEAKIKSKIAKYPEGKLGEDLYIERQMQLNSVDDQIETVPKPDVDSEKVLEEFKAIQEQDKRIAQSKTEGVALGRSEEDIIAAKNAAEAIEQPATVRDLFAQSDLESATSISKKVAKQKAPSREEAGSIGNISLADLMRQGEDEQPPSSSAA
jgi:hypothetical protein